MDRLTCLQAFASVAQEGSFTQAGKRLGLSKVLVSKYVGQLEDALEARLFHRTTRHVSLTTLGSAYLERCLPLLEEFNALEEGVREQQTGASGLLRITAPMSFQEMSFVPLVRKFTELHPRVTLDIQLADRFVDIVGEGFDLAIRVGELEDSSLVARRIGRLPIRICASPDYLAEHGTPQTPSDLEAHKLIVDSNYRGGSYWDFEHRQNASRTEKVRLQPYIRVNSARATRDLIVEGMGVAYCPAFNVDQDIAGGQLVELLKDWQTPSKTIYALYPHRRHLSAKVRLFIEMLQESKTLNF